MAPDRRSMVAGKEHTVLWFLGLPVFSHATEHERPLLGPIKTQGHGTISAQPLQFDRLRTSEILWH